jgi:hypothetical protein
VAAHRVVAAAHRVVAAAHRVVAAAHRVVAAAHRVVAAAHRVVAAAHRVVAAAHRAEEVRSAAWAARLQTDSCCTRAAEAVATMQGFPTVQRPVVSNIYILQ